MSSPGLCPEIGSPSGSALQETDASSKFWTRAASNRVGLVLIAGLTLILYAPVLASLARQWWQDPNYGHGFFVPLFSGYVLWQQRSQWRSQPLRPRSFGFIVMVASIAVLALGTLGIELFTARVSLLPLLGGMVLFFCGYKMLRAVAFPLGYLVFMIPLPAIV